MARCGGRGARHCRVEARNHHTRLFPGASHGVSRFARTLPLTFFLTPNPTTITFATFLTIFCYRKDFRTIQYSIGMLLVAHSLNDPARGILGVGMGFLIIPRSAVQGKCKPVSTSIAS